MFKRVIEMFRPSYRYRYRSAETGHFVSKAYALLYPATTVRERV